jgi:hypothetical protein
MSPRAGLDAVAKRKILCPCGESNPSHPVRSLQSRDAVLKVCGNSLVM